MLALGGTGIEDQGPLEVIQKQRFEDVLALKSQERR